MNPKQYAAIKRGSDGEIDLTEMTNPTGKYGAGDGTDVYVSLVRTGANGLSVRAKSADAEVALPAPASIPTGKVGAWNRMMEFLGFGGGAKEKSATTFEANAMPRDVMQAVWSGTDILCTTLHAIMEDENEQDKAAAIRRALQGFATYVESKANIGASAKREDLPVIKAASIKFREDTANEAGLSAKAGKVFSSANAGKILTAAEGIAAQAADLIEMLKAAGAIPDPKEKSEDPMKPEHLQALITASTLAAKAANPALTDEQAQVVGTRVAMKAAGMESYQENVGDQARQAGLNTGSMPDLTAQIEAAIGRSPSMKGADERLKKLELDVYGAPAAKSADGKDVPAVPGLKEVATAALELAVKASEGFDDEDPEAPARPNARPEGGPSVKSGSLDELLEGSPFALGMRATR